MPPRGKQDLRSRRPSVELVPKSKPHSGPPPTAAFWNELEPSGFCRTTLRFVPAQSRWISETMRRQAWGWSPIGYFQVGDEKGVCWMGPDTSHSLAQDKSNPVHRRPAPPHRQGKPLASGYAAPWQSRQTQVCTEPERSISRNEIPSFSLIFWSKL